MIVTIKILRQSDVVDIVNIVFDATDIYIIIGIAVYCCIVNTMERLRKGGS